MRSSTWMVTEAATKMWVRELAANLRVSSRMIVFMLWVLLVFAVLFGFLLASVSSSQLGGILPVELTTSILRAAIGSSLTISGLVVTVLSLTLPARTSLRTLLDLLPISRTNARIGEFAPLFVAGFVASTVLSAASIMVMIRLLQDPWLLISGLLMLFIAIVITLVFVLGVFQIANAFLVQYLRIPQAYALGIAAFSSMGLSLLFFSSDMLTYGVPGVESFDLRDLSLHRVVTELISERNQIFSTLVLVAWMLISGAIFCLGAFVQRQETGPRYPVLFIGVAPGVGWFRASLWFEGIIALRTPQFVFTSVSLLPLVLVAKWLQDHSVISQLADVLKMSIPVIPSMLVLHSVGRTMNMRWIGKLLVGEGGWWIAPKVIATLLVSLSLSVLVVTFEFQLGMLSASQLPEVAGRVILVYSAALLSGAVVPYSEEQSISSLFSGMLTVFLVLPISALVDLGVVSMGPGRMLVVYVMVFTLFFALFMQVTHGRRFVQA